MDTELILTGAFLGTGLLAYVVIPGSSSCGTGCSTTWKNQKGTGKHENKGQGQSPPCPFVLRHTGLCGNPGLQKPFF